MRRVCLSQRQALGKDTLLKLRLNSPAGGWFPALQVLDWCITRSHLPYADLFFSPHLRKIFLRLPLSWYLSGVPHDALPAIASAISTLPTSALQSLSVFSLAFWSSMTPWGDFAISLSSVVLRCGPSLKEFTSTIPLSDAAVNHLIRLPHLRTCHIEGPPPSYSASHLPLIFPPLTEFVVRADAARGWLSLLELLGGCVAPLSKVKESLRSLRLPSPTIDAPFASLIQTFRNLANLNIDRSCYPRGGEGQCIFKLNNDHVTELAVALPRLELLVLGRPCFDNTCTTTVACLLSISVYCVKLRSLEIHFNTANIVDDLKGISNDLRFQELRSRPRCKLSRLDVYRIPLALNEPGFETVVNGMIDIFPSLGYCAEVVRGSGWRELSERLRKVQRNRGALDTS